MRTPNLIKAIGLTLGLVVSFASTAAHAGDYLNVTATPPQYLTISGVKYLCFSVMAPTSAQFDWCLPATDPAAAGMATVVANAFERNKVIAVGCSACAAISGDSKWTGTKWVPEFVFVGTQGRAYPN
jgi:hypothetical protein